MADPPPYPGNDDMKVQQGSNLAQPGSFPNQPSNPAAPATKSATQPNYTPVQSGYPPAQAGYPPPQALYTAPQQGPRPPQPQSTNVVIAPPTSSVAVSQIYLGRDPMRITCQYCQADVVTRTSYSIGIIAWISCGVILLFGCIFGCCLIPFFINSIKDVSHSCPNCQQKLGKWRMMGI